METYAPGFARTNSVREVCTRPRTLPAAIAPMHQCIQQSDPWRTALLTQGIAQACADHSRAAR